MACGKTHDKITYIISPLIFIISIRFLQIKYCLILFLSFLFSGLMFSGDLDINSVQQNRWHFLKFIWKPYSKAFKHRSFFTHSVIIATIIRLLYINFILILILLPLQIFPMFRYNNLYNIFYYYKNICFIIFIGLCLGSLSHTLVDIIYSKTKRIINFFKK